VIRLSRLFICAAALALFGFGPHPVQAHEIRPGYLELRENAPGHYSVLWKQPANGEYALRMTPTFPDSCTLNGNADRQLLPGELVSRFSLACTESLDGQTITIAGLETTLTDVLISVRKSNGVEETHLARPAAISVTIGEESKGFAAAAIYLQLGVQHILMGIDHLLFVLGLLLIVRDRWMLIKTISAFTVAHSITLAAATLGAVTIPAAPLNAAIALSILFLGPEIMRMRAGGTSLTIRKPWLVAFAFGLLHGLGFASGLAAMGLPRSEVPMALLLFNCGVEIGQLGFVFVVLGLERAFHLMEIRWWQPIILLPSYTVGVLGAVWSLQRLLIYFGLHAL